MSTKAKVNPRTTTPTHTLSLSDGVSNYGLRLEGDYKYIQETPQTPSTLMINSQGGQYGDFDPSMSHIQQNTWVGGRGSERFVDDATRFFDSHNLWSLSDGSLLPTMQWHFCIGAHQKQNNLQLAKNYNWRSLANISYSVQFTASASYTASKLELWVRKVGNPSDLSVAVWSDSGDKPNTSLASATLTKNSISTNDPVLRKFIIDVALTGATKYHITAKGASTDNKQNHWEIMTTSGDYIPLAYTSADESTWTSSDYAMYYHIAESQKNVPYKYFVFKDELYAVQIYESGTAVSSLYKLVPTASSYGDATHIDFVATEITSTGLASVCDVLVINNIVYFAQGSENNIRRWNGTTWADDGTNEAHILVEFTHPSDGIVIYRATGSSKSQVSYSVIKDWGTNLAFGTSAKTDNGSVITSLIGYNNLLYVLKTDSVWTTNGTDSISKFNSSVDDSYDSSNGRAAVVHGQYMYFTMDKGLQQLYGTTVTDVGPERSASVPPERSGYVSDLESVLSKLFVAIDAKGGYSTILVFDGVNYHEIWRGESAGKSINNLFWLSNKNVESPYLFWDYGGELCFMRFPDYGFHPYRSNTIYYAPFGSVTSSTIDMNVVRLPKIFKDLSIVSKNLYNSRTDFELSPLITNDSRIEAYIQADSDVDTDNWIHAGTMYVSPFDSVEVDKSNAYMLRFKLCLFVSDAKNPPILSATVVEGLARTPIKYQWVLRVKTATNQSTLNGAPDHDPDELLGWLKEKAGKAEMLTMHSIVPDLHLKKVMIDPPSVRRDFVDPTQKSWGGVITVVIREA